MRKTTIALGLGNLALLLGVLASRNPEDTQVSEPPETSAAEVLESNDIIKSREGAALTVPSAGSFSETPNTAVKLKDFERLSELNDFKLLSKKPFLSDKENARKNSLLHNEKFIEDLRRLFKVPNEYQDLVVQQHNAVDFLLAALNGEPRSAQAAAAVLKSIIQDPATENEALPEQVRENLAGIKAEVLFKWSAQEPLISEEMQQWLPGPVSQKIWNSIISQQEMNLAESVDHSR